MRRDKPLPHFQVDFEYLVGATDGLTGDYRHLSPSTIHMAVAALDAMHFNRYWRAGDSWLNNTQILQKNDLVDVAIYELLTPVDVSQAQPGAAPAGVFGGADLVTCEDGEMLGYVRLNGVTYLVDNCGCGDSKLFALTEAQVVLDVDGTAKVLNSKQTDIGGSTNYVVQDTLLNCFASKAVPYLLERAGLFFEFTHGLATGITSLLVGDVGDFLNYEEIEGELLDIDGSSLVDWVTGATVEEAQEVFADSSFIALMIENWTFDSLPSRYDLIEWVRTAPRTWESATTHRDVYVKNILYDWATYSIMSGYYGDLAIFYQECESGNTLEDVQDYVNQDLAYSVVEQSGYNYPVWDWEPMVTVQPAGYDVFADGPVPAGTSLLGLSVYFTDIEGGDWRAGILDTNGAGPSAVHGYWSDGAHGTAITSDARLIMNELMSVEGLDAYVNTSGGASITGLKLGYGTTETLYLRRVVCVGEALT